MGRTGRHRDQSNFRLLHRPRSRQFELYQPDGSAGGLRASLLALSQQVWDKKTGADQPHWVLNVFYREASTRAQLCGP